MKFSDKLKELIEVRQPITYIRSELEKECLVEILNAVEYVYDEANVISYESLPFVGCQQLEISSSTEIKKTKVYIKDEYSEIEVNSPSLFNTFLDSVDKRTIVVLNDYQILSSTSPIFTRLIRRFAEKRLSEREVTFIIVSNNYEINKELEHLTYVLDYDNPSKEDIYSFLESYGILNNIAELDDTNTIESLSNKLIGFNYGEIINLLNKSLARDGKINTKIIEEEKLQEITKSSMLNIKKTDKTLDDVGGNGRFKDYIKEIEMCMTDEAAELGLTPKGHLAVGIAGSAKTFTAEALAASWNVPFIKLELNKILSKFAGESEKNMAKALELIRSCAPCVCLIDEVEKVLGGK